MAEYINGRDFFNELVIYKNLCADVESQGLERPPVTDKICHAIIQIGTRMANSYNFVNYTFKDEMIADGILKCLTKIHLFDPQVSENPFGYVSQIFWNSFVNRIKIEQYQCSVKAKMIREKMSSEFVAHGVDADADEGDNSFVNFLKENDAYTDYHEERQKKSKEIHPFLKHRNKTPYKRKEPLDVPVVSEEPEVDLFALNEA